MYTFINKYVQENPTGIYPKNPNFFKTRVLCVEVLRYIKSTISVLGLGNQIIFLETNVVKHTMHKTRHLQKMIIIYFTKDCYSDF